MLQPQSQTCINAAECSLKFAELCTACREPCTSTCRLHGAVGGLLLQVACYSHFHMQCCRLPRSACFCPVGSLCGAAGRPHRRRVLPAPIPPGGLTSQGFKEMKCCMLTYRRCDAGSTALAWGRPAWLAPAWCCCNSMLAGSHLEVQSLRCCRLPCEHGTQAAPASAWGPPGGDPPRWASASGTACWTW